MEIAIKKYTFEELENEEKNFQRLSESERASLLVQLHESFAGLSPEQDYEGRYSYFRWYAYLVWYDLLVFNKESFVSFVPNRMIYEGILAGYDVWKKIILYFNVKCIEDDDYRTLYIQTKDAFINSDAIIGEWQGEYYRVADAVKEKSLLRSMGNDSMRLAEYMNKLKKMMAFEDKFAERFYATTADDALRDLNDLIDFFLDTVPEDMQALVDMTVNPEAYGLRRTAQDENVNERPVVAKLVVKTPTTPPPAPVQSKPIQTPSPINKTEKIMPTTPAKPTPAEIRAKIDASFEKDEQGNYKDMDGVFIVLGRAAAKYNDPKISELYYFDENSGEFKWNV
jgi:hypothetical protein